MPTDKKHGILSDPWRAPAAAKPVAESPEVRIFKQTQLSEKKPKPAPIEERPDRRATLELRGYGAITARNCENSSQTALSVLSFLAANLKAVEPILTDYGILVTQTTARPKNVKFFVQRDDGWLLAVPGVSSRESGAMQLIQALIQINALPGFKKKLEDAGISAYKF